MCVTSVCCLFECVSCTCVLWVARKQLLRGCSSGKSVGGRVYTWVDSRRRKVDNLAQSGAVGAENRAERSQGYWLLLSRGFISPRSLFLLVLYRLFLFHLVSVPFCRDDVGLPLFSVPSL